MARYRWLIVGAGFTGAVLAERIACVLSEPVLVIDRRNHIAGNAFDDIGSHGLLVHKYGPHIFHTNSDKVWQYVSRFTEWRPYYHRVLGMVEGNAVPLPFNLNAIAVLFPRFLAEELSQSLVRTYGYGKKIPILKLRESGDAQLDFLAGYIYDHVFKSYTKKQWGLRPEDLDPSVTARVPVSITRDDRYFQDAYQAMPKDGYTEMFRKILSHPNIDIALSTDFDSVKALYPEARIVFTGPIDQFFDFQHGRLPYRSIRFRLREENCSFVQPVGTVNYPNEFDFTRITEIKHLTGQTSASTVLVEEYPEAFEAGKNEPYYPIPTPDTAAQLRPYLKLAQAEEGKTWFAGRLGDYAYYNMDQACARALALFEKRIAPAVCSQVAK